MITIELLGYHFTISKKGKVTSDDADAVTMRAVRDAAADVWGSPLSMPFAAAAALERRYHATIVDAPAMVGQTGGEIIY